MKRFGIVNTFVLAFLVGLGLLIVTANDRERASVNLLRPTTLVSFVASRLHAVQSYVSELIDDGSAGFRQTVQKHEAPKKSLER